MNPTGRTRRTWLPALVRTPATTLRRHGNVLGSIGAVFAGNTASSLLGATGGLILARFVGPEVLGEFRVYTIPLMYLAVLHLGTFDGLWRQIPFHTGRDERDEVLRVASVAGAWNLWVSGAVSAVFTVCAVRSFLRGDSHGVTGWLTQALLSWSTFYGGYLTATFRTLDQFVALTRIQVVQAVLNFVLVFTVPSLGFHGLCVRSGAPSALGLALFQHSRPLRTDLRFDIKSFGKLVKVGLPLSVWGSLYTSLWTAAEYSLMLHLAGLKAIGFFSVGLVLREGISLLPQAAQQVLLPRTVEKFARDSSVTSAVSQSYRAATVLTVGTALLVLLVSPILKVSVSSLLPKYAEGTTVMILCVWMAVVGAAGLPLNVLFATGSSWLYGRGVLLGLIVFPVTAYLLCPLVGGMLAVAIGSLVGRTARTAVAYFDLAFLVNRETR